ncbi:hypothetical protein ACHAWF_007040 [Thalassiosira exigua]
MAPSSLARGAAVAAALLSSCGTWASAEGSPKAARGGTGGDGVGGGGGLRRNRDRPRRLRKQQTRRKSHPERAEGATILDEEDVAFWTRQLVGERGKGTDSGGGSLPFVPRPPSPPIGPEGPRPTPFPTVRPTPRRPPSPIPPDVATPLPTDPAFATPAPFDTPAPTDAMIQTPAPTDAVVPPGPPPITPFPTAGPPVTDPPVPATAAPTGPCGLTRDERRAQILDNLSVVTFPDAFDVVNSPQRKALDWIVDDDGRKVCPDDGGLVQRYALSVFYYSTKGDFWKQCSAPSQFAPAQIAAANAACTLTTANATAIFPGDVRGSNAWLTPSSECEWGGISCYGPATPKAYKVNVVEFENNDLGGALPAELSRLKDLRFLALERGGLAGPIPASYGDLKSLLLMDFDFNELTGQLPSALWKLTGLRQLDLNDNEFTGTLSSDIGKLKQLRFFQIDNNNIEGEIPKALGDIPNLSLIGLSGNDFTGAMPSQVCDLRPSPLQTLVVDCGLECQIPECCTACVPERRE